MSTIINWSKIASSNTTPSPNGAPEGMIGNTVDDWGREFMSAIAKWDKDTNDALQATHSSGNVLTVTTNQSFTSYQNGMYLTVQIAGTALSSGDVYVNVDGLGNKLVGTGINADPSNIDGKDFPVGSFVTLFYSSNYGRFITDMTGKWSYSETVAGVGKVMTLNSGIFIYAGTVTGALANSTYNVSTSFWAKQVMGGAASILSTNTTGTLLQPYLNITTSGSSFNIAIMNPNSVSVDLSYFIMGR